MSGSIYLETSLRTGDLTFSFEHFKASTLQCNWLRNAASGWLPKQ